MIISLRGGTPLWPRGNTVSHQFRSDKHETLWRCGLAQSILKICGIRIGGENPEDRPREWSLSASMSRTQLHARVLFKYFWVAHAVDLRLDPQPLVELLVVMASNGVSTTILTPMTSQSIGKQRAPYRTERGSIDGMVESYFRRFRETRSPAPPNW